MEGVNQPMGEGVVIDLEGGVEVENPEVAASRSSSSCVTPCTHLMMLGDHQSAFNIGVR